MIEMIMLIFMSVAAVRSANALRKDKALFEEFKVRQSPVPLIYLFPAGPLLLLLLPFWVGLVPAALLALGCYLPALYFLKPARQVFERSGTDRTRRVQDALGVAFISGMGGIVYVIMRTSIALLVNAGSALR